MISNQLINYSELRLASRVGKPRQWSGTDQRRGFQVTVLDADQEGQASTGFVPVRLVIVGTGGIGRLHAELAATIAEVELVGLCSLDDDAGALARSLSVPLVGDYHDVLEMEPEAVIVATPNDTHREIGGFFVGAGIGTLVEKPIAESIQAARELCDIAVAAGVPMLVGHHRRYNNRVQAAREFVSAKIGRLVATNTLVTMRKPDSYYHVEWRRREGAGPLLVNLIHEVDLLRAVCGEIESVQAASAKLGRDFDFDDTAVMLAHFAGGALGTLILSESTPSPWSWEASVSDGMGFHNAGQDHARFIGTEASLSFPSLTVWQYGADDPDPGWNSPLLASRLTVDQHSAYGQRPGPGAASPSRRRTPQNPYVEQLAHLARVVRGLEDPLVPGDEGLRSLAVVDAVILAARTCDIVRVDDLLT